MPREEIISPIRSDGRRVWVVSDFAYAVVGVLTTEENAVKWIAAQGKDPQYHSVQDFELDTAT